MKAVILAGGFGTRITEESIYKPKPLIEIGGLPIICHIMKLYSKVGINDFIICAGYKQDVIKQYFSSYYVNNVDYEFDLKNNTIRYLEKHCDDWKVSVIDTGLNTMTGGRIKRISKYLPDNEPFCLTYGDGVSDVPIRKVIDFHNESGKIATLTAVHPESRFGFLDFDKDNVTAFREKKLTDVGWINGGFMVLEKEVIDYIKDDSTIFEREPLESLANNRELNAYKHDGFWQCMDSVRDKEKLQKLWDNNAAPWRCW